MFGIGWPELIAILVVAIVVIGPEDMPKALNGLGKLMRKFREFTKGFQDIMDHVEHEAGLDEIVKETNKAVQDPEVIRFESEKQELLEQEKNKKKVDQLK